jgi:hypothetical protein
MYLYLTCYISYGVNPYLDLWNVNKFKFKFKTEAYLVVGFGISSVGQFCSVISLLF